MQIGELTKSEKVVLVGMARHLVMLDGEMSDSELFEIIRIGIEIGREDFESALEATEEIHEDEARTLALSADVSRADARTRILSELHRIASGDGVHSTEVAFLSALELRWG
ncbi:MAG: hypothetical protein H6736_11710 [Alphaproteobacteria bacterium]|nr:hypothetical protein [Alphaproteobacteria bacterium]MCB9692469.1 hypothetical protein [Alphaproteobacteria bacterium]